MSVNRRRRAAQQSVRGVDGWFVTYADMVSLLLAFFVMLFTFSSMDLQKFHLLMESLQGSLGVLDGGRTITTSRVGTDDGMDVTQLVPATPEGTVPDIPASEPSIPAELEQVYQRLQHIIAEESLSATVAVYIDEHAVVVRFADQVLFDLGQAHLREEFRQQLQQFVAAIDLWPHAIRVEGHADTLPIQTMVYPSNWELSTARASAVVRFFVDQGIDPRRLSASGFGEFRPIDENATPEGRARNRRVDVVLYRNERSEGSVLGD